MTLRVLEKEVDAETRFIARASRGTAERGLALLDKLDQTSARSAKRRRSGARSSTG
jgi:hypothetical protein